MSSVIDELIGSPTHALHVVVRELVEFRRAISDRRRLGGQEVLIVALEEQFEQKIAELEAALRIKITESVWTQFLAAFGDGLDLAEYSEPIAVRELHRTGCEAVPIEHGVYLVVRPSQSRPQFVAAGSGGRFKNLDPNYPLETLEHDWIDGALVLYVGKAGGARGLRQRIRQLVRFGFGHNVGHRGGRAMWQLRDAHDLQVRWRSCKSGEDAARLEATTLREFASVHDGRRPFANMVG